MKTKNLVKKKLLKLFFGKEKISKIEIEIIKLPNIRLNISK